jgi:uncharacterized integral membrane protein
MNDYVLAIESMRFHAADTARRVLFVVVAALVAVCAVVGMNAALANVDALRAGLVVNVFLEPNATKIQSETALGLLRRLDGIDSLTVQSPEETQRAFAERFGNDIDRLLPESPFPIAITLHPKADERSPRGLQAIASRAEGIRSVADVVVREEFAQAVEARRAQTTLLVWLVGVVLVLAVLLLLWSALNANHVSHTHHTHHAHQPRSFAEGLLTATLGVVLAALLTVALWMLLATRLVWLGSLSKLPVVWTLVGVYAASVLLSAPQALVALGDDSGDA